MLIYFSSEKKVDFIVQLLNVIFEVVVLLEKSGSTNIFYNTNIYR